MDKEAKILIIVCILSIFFGAELCWIGSSIYGSFVKSKVDVQAMRFACREAGYDDYFPLDSVANYAHCMNIAKSLVVLGESSGVDFTYSYEENRVVLVGGEYVVQVKSPVMEWK